MELSFGAGHGESDRVARRIDDAVDFGFKTAARAAMRPRAVFFFSAGGMLTGICRGAVCLVHLKIIFRPCADFSNIKSEKNG